MRVEYDPAEVDRFIELADAIEDAFPSIIVEGNEGEEGRPGSFEVCTEDGRCVFSRLGSGVWPEVGDLLVRIRAAGPPAGGREAAGSGSKPGCS